MNEIVDASLETLLKDYRVIHQSGDADFDRFKKRKSGMTPELVKNYEVKGSFDSPEVAEIFRKADIVVSRGGANTVSEIIVTKSLP